MKTNTLLILTVILLFPFISRSQAVVAGWSFKKGVNSEKSADSGTVYNKHICKIEATDNDGGYRLIEFKNGIDAPDDYAAMANQWDNGSMDKFWQIVFISKDYENLTLASRQESGENRTGPKFFKPQYKIASGPWTDFPMGKVIEVANDWTTGILDSLNFPAVCNNITDSIYVRWLMYTNINIDNDTVIAIGINKIDDIFIRGDKVIGRQEYSSENNNNKVYPSVSSGSFNVLTVNDVKEVLIYNNLGSLVSSYKASATFSIDLSDQPEGMYFVIFKDPRGLSVRTEKIIVRK
jgi:hypothetical protein